MTYLCSMSDDLSSHLGRRNHARRTCSTCSVCIVVHLPSLSQSSYHLLGIFAMVAAGITCWIVLIFSVAYGRFIAGAADSNFGRVRKVAWGRQRTSKRPPPRKKRKYLHTWLMTGRIQQSLTKVDTLLIFFPMHMLRTDTQSDMMSSHHFASPCCTPQTSHLHF